MPQTAQPGRYCPLHYRYRPESLALLAADEVQTLYVIGGLYGNRPALQAVLTMAALETPPPRLCFNGDFNWFDIHPDDFAVINRSVLAHDALRGNVETELAGDDHDAGCGCAYPDWVDADTVHRSNRIMQRLRQTARAFPELTRRLLALPMSACYRIGDRRVGVVHGDAESLAGWGFAQEALAGDRLHSPCADWFDRAAVDVFASSHTCLPVLADFGAGRMLINNGAAGMPNFKHMGFGLLSRISLHPTPVAGIFGTRLGDLHIDALAIDYDPQAWQAQFLRDWPAGSPAHQSYYQRISTGPDYQPQQAVRLGD